MSRSLLCALLATILLGYPSATRAKTRPVDRASPAAAAAAAQQTTAPAPASALLAGVDAPASRLPAARGGVSDADSEIVAPQILIVNDVAQLQRAVAAGVEHIVVRKNLEDIGPLEPGPILSDVSRTKVIRVRV